MKSPFQAIGYQLLSASLKNDPECTPLLPRVSRRAFLLASAALTSCKAATSTNPPPIAGQPESVKTKPNPSYRTPPVKGPVRRNPDVNVSSEFSRGAGVTFTRVHVSGKYIALTFDDGPHPKNTPRLLDILRERNVKATFYVIGSNVDLHPAILRRAVAEGHEIGNHTYTHRLLSKLSDDEVRKELNRTREAIGKAAGIQPRTMRPPYGGLLQRQRELVHQEFGYPTILWSVDPLDWKKPGVSVVTSRMLAGASPGGILLCHDIHAPTIDSTPGTIEGLLRQGYQFVTVSQLIALQTPVTTAQVAIDTATS